jgi:hypothetical protein
MAKGVETLTSPKMTQPASPEHFGTDKCDATASYVWQAELKEFMRDKKEIAKQTQQLYALVIGQCTDALVARVEAHPKFATVADNRDGIALLIIIKSICFNFQDQKYVPQSVFETKRRFYSLKQAQHETVAQYYERFQNQASVLEQCGGTIGGDHGVHQIIYDEMKVDATKASDPVKETVRAEARERALAIGLLLGADRNRHGAMIREYENAFTAGRDEWPRTLLGSYRVLTNWKRDQAPSTLDRTDGVSFATAATGGRGESGRGRGGRGEQGGRGGRGRYMSHVRCYNCGQTGHLSYDCPVDNDEHQHSAETNLQEGEEQGDADDETAEQFLTNAAASGAFDEGDHHFTFQISGCEATSSVTLKLSENAMIPKTWILLDNQSTVDVFANPRLLSNIRKTEKTLHIHTQTGVGSTNLQGDLEGYGTVWYHKEGIANILSLQNVRARHVVTFDSHNRNEFIVHKENGEAPRRFRMSPRGLYYMDTAGGVTLLSTVAEKKAPEGVTLLSTVAEKKAQYTQADYERAVAARALQKSIGRPSVRTLIRIIEGKRLLNCPVVRDDVMAAEDIFGPDVGSLKGKTTRQSSEAVRAEISPIPLSILERYRVVTLGGDVMKVNGIPFFMSISSALKFGTAELLKNQKMETTLGAIKHILQIYHKRGFRVETMFTDGEFGSLRGDLAGLGVTLNTVSRDEHVPVVERRIRSIKERTRSTYNMMPFKKVPHQMIVQMVYHSNFWLNVFPPTDGVSGVTSPRELVTGLGIDYLKHCRLECGAYAQVHEEHDNSMASRTVGAIAMRPTGNAQGGYYFFSLNTGRILNRNRWTELPMPTEVIERVHALAARGSENLRFTDGRGGVYDDDDDDYTPEDADDDDEENDFADIDEDEVRDLHEDAQGAKDAQTKHGDGFDEDDHSDDLDQPYAGDEVKEEEEEEEEEAGAVPSRVARELRKLATEDEAPTVLEGRTRSQRAENFATAEGDSTATPRGQHRPDAAHPAEQNKHLSDMESIVMTQVNMKKGLKLYGQRGIDAVLVEMKQLHDRAVIKPVDAKSLSPAEKRASLQYLMFLKEKRCGMIKGRGVADGRKQRLTAVKGAASAPTVSIEALLLTCVVDAKERRDVATADIPGAFLQSDMDEVVHVRLEGTMAELLAKLDQKMYSKHTVIEHGKVVLYVVLLKALYGTLRAALLFWRKLSAALVSWGFVINPYDWCVANKEVNGRQCTVVWHVDDLKVSHVETEAVDTVLGLIDAEFGKEAPLTVTRGKVHDYLGMTLDFSDDGKVKILMLDYIDGMLESLDADMDGTSGTPAASHLFTVNADGQKLDAAKAELYHHLVAKNLFLCKRARPDLQTAVAFLSTRVQSPDTDDYKKLRRLMQYIRLTRDLVLTLEADNLRIIKWYVDASYAVHPDMKSHTGGALTLGKGVVYGTSTRQKLNTKSSTEAELVGVADVLPQALWTRYFMEAQGQEIDDNLLYQDNESSIKLENNGRKSSGKRTRHINVRYFFITDRIKCKEIRVAYCPTGDMLADYFTKPLQGALFRRMRDMVLNIPHSVGPASIEPHSEPAGPKECVGTEGQTDGFTTVPVTRKKQYQKVEK